MSVEANKETLGFQTEVQQLLDLMIHSLYSNKEIFLRELISNASDASDKLRFAALADDSLYENDSDIKIRVEFNEELKTVTIIDNGIGMNREDVISHLGTIAKSGTRQFFDSLTGDQRQDAQLIGQFGVGFYSSFIVADKVEVETRKAGEDSSQGVRWTSEGKGDYELENIEKADRGTRITLFLKEDENEFLNSWRLRNIITKYSNHISFPIEMVKEAMGGEEEDEKKDSAPEYEAVNSATALWTKSKRDIKDEEYNEFYKTVSHDFEDPLAHVHSRVEGKTEYTSLLFIPARAPFDLWDREQKRGLKLFVKRVFIMDEADQLLPNYLRFVKGIVDSDDLPLNVSREILQQNKTIDSMRAGCTKKVLDLLKSMANNEPEKYATFWEQFGRVIKEGVIEENDKKEDIAKLFRFASTHTDTEEQNVSLEDYISRMQEDQKAIYFVTAESFSTAKNSPHLEIFRKKGIEVLLLTDPLDEWVTTHLTEFDGKNLQSVSQGELDLDGDEADADSDDIKADEKELEPFIKKLGDALGEQVKEVRSTKRLTSSPACLVADNNDMGLNLERILKASGQNVPGTKPILEVNAEHPIVVHMQKEQDETRFADWSKILFDQALLSEGGQLDDPAGFVHRFNNLFIEIQNQ